MAKKINLSSARGLPAGTRELRRQAKLEGGVNPDNVSREMFISALDEARKKTGGVFKLSLELRVHPRRIGYWLAGEGPSYNKMQELYFKLKEFNHGESEGK